MHFNNNSLFVGFEDLFDRVKMAESVNTSYPPYNLVKLNEDKYEINVAVAGFSKNEVSITLERRNLTVKGTKNTSDEGKTFLHKGVATRNFIRTFSLADSLKVTKAEIFDGILVISLVREVPEDQKPKDIKVH